MGWNVGFKLHLFGRGYVVIDTLYIGAEKFPVHSVSTFNISGVI
jgi:hypothetical protein